MDLHANHPGHRLTSYRSEGFLSWYNVPQEPSVPLAVTKDFMRTDVNIAVSGGSYATVVNRPGTDYIRIFTPIDDQLLSFMTFGVYCKKAVPFQIYVEFEYRMPYRINRLGAAAINNSRLLFTATQNGSFISGYNPLILPLPTNDGWVKVVQTITGFTSSIGPASVQLSRRSYQNFTDIRNARAYVMTNNPDDVYTTVNTFDVNKYFNITNDRKYMMPISANPLQLKTVKF